ncbi:MAG TPA: hypothetical protein VMN57_10935 [Anaerolineales bacterium]|nr:hypothetical protein [Anaerolineales bacterium]
MLDDFRQQADDGSLFEDDDPLDFEDLGDFDQEYEDFEDEESPPVQPGGVRVQETGGQFMGMTAPQRFVLAAILLVDVCIFSFLILLITERIAL